MKKICTCFFLISCFQLNAQLLNPHVEQGVPGWDSIGTGTAIRCVGDTVSSPYYTTGYLSTNNILPQYGSHFMEIFSGGSVNTSALESFAGVPNGTIDTLNPFYFMFPGSASNATNGSAIRQTIPVFTGQALQFNYLYGTNEDPLFWGCDHSSDYIDYAYFTISSNDTLLAFLLSSTADMIGNCGIYGGLYGCDMPSTNANVFCTVGSVKFFACPQWQTFIFPFTQNDTVTISFGVVNVGDNTGTSRLLLDNFSLNAAPVLGNTSINCNANQSNTIGFTNINNQTNDIDEDSICSFAIQSLPVNGMLVLNNGLADTLNAGDLGTVLAASLLDSLVYIPNTNFAGADSFQLQVIDCYNVYSNTATVLLNVSFAGIENNAELVMELYPNPTQGLIYLKTPLLSGDLKAEVLDPNGRLVKVGYMTTQLDLSELEPGLYFIRLSQGNNQKVIRTIKVN